MRLARGSFQDSGPEKREGPAAWCSGPFIVPGNDLLSRGKHYHRPRMLNGRVRNGNGWGHPGLVTGSFLYSKRWRYELPRTLVHDVARAGSMRSSVWLLVPVG